MTKIIWGIDIPYNSTKIDWDATHKLPIHSAPIRVPCVRIHKQMFFELCDICGSQVPYGRASRGITTCCPKCNAKKWDVKNGLVIERERNANGVRPTSFWGTISYDCFKRDNFTCQHCKKDRDELQSLKQKDPYNTDYILNCHHIKPIKDGGNNKLENLITLCGKCHKKEHSRPKNIARKHKDITSFT